MRAITTQNQIFKNENLEAIESTWLSGTKLIALNHTLFKSLVPEVGTPKTVAGKKVLKVNRMLYRLNNAGDKNIVLTRMGFIYDPWCEEEERKNIRICYQVLNDALLEVILTKAGKAALKGTEFEGL